MNVDVINEKRDSWKVQIYDENSKPVTCLFTIDAFSSFDTNWRSITAREAAELAIKKQVYNEWSNIYYVEVEMNKETKEVKLFKVEVCLEIKCYTMEIKE